ncbi:MAG: RHS repeat-associated core domain-containing protein [Marinifilaceae bacterium]|jgi:RHS repeat-associated protein|nr:RHS repeat-associated core domain-containing protein [Marinifilaceae bacterium]
MADAKSEILELNHYYPFGMRMAMHNSTKLVNQHYLYNGKEKQDETGWLDYGWRMLDISLGRWMCLDPLAEERYSLSGYHFCSLNPISRIDSDGKADTYYVDGEGEVLLDTNDGSNNVVNVSDDKVDEFKRYAEHYNNGNTSIYDSKGWNNFWTSEFGLADTQLSSKQVSLLGMLNSEWSQHNAITYWLNPTKKNALAFANSEAMSQWTNPFLVVGGLSAGVAGLNSLPKTAPRKSVGPIKGYTRHGLNQAISRNGGRGVKVAAIKDAVLNPKKIIQQSEGRVKYVGKKATVILNSEGEIITTYGKSRGSVN